MYIPAWGVEMTPLCCVNWLDQLGLAPGLQKVNYLDRHGRAGRPTFVPISPCTVQGTGGDFAVGKVSFLCNLSLSGLPFAGPQADVLVMMRI